MEVNGKGDQFNSKHLHKLPSLAIIYHFWQFCMHINQFYNQFLGANFSITYLLIFSVIFFLISLDIFEK